MENYLSESEEMDLYYHAKELFEWDVDTYMEDSKDGILAMCEKYNLPNPYTE